MSIETPTRPRDRSTGYEFPLADVDGADGRPPLGRDDRPVGRGGGDDDGDRGRIARVLAAGAFAMALATALLLTFVILRDDGPGRDAATPAPAAAAAAAGAGAHDMSAMGAPADGAAAAAEPVRAEPFAVVDPDLPPVPAGPVKKFHVEVYEHVTKVADDLPATRVWSYAVNGVEHRGTGVSQPMVVNQGDEVQITLDNGLRSDMAVQYPHSIDLHSAEVAPNVDYKTIAPGESHTFRFRADHAGVFMYHCATDPVLLHTAAGMVGMMVVKPRDLAPVDRELWVTQQEYYLGPNPGDNADMAKAQAKQPDVIAFNGYANQYAKKPISVQPGERIRMYVLNAGPSIWTAFHVIGSVFDRTVVEGTVGHDVQTISLAPSQGGWVEFTLDRKGTYPFVDHAFADMGKGAAGVLAAGVPAKPGMGH